MSVREAILKAAHHIECYPGEFRFSSVNIPEGPGCGTAGCAVGWIAHFNGLTEDEAYELCHDSTILYAAKEILGMDGRSHDPSHPFYKRMSDLQDGWMFSAEACAEGLRLYADKYFPQTDHIPASVRAIFTEKAVA